MHNYLLHWLHPALSSSTPPPPAASTTQGQGAGAGIGRPPHVPGSQTVYLGHNNNQGFNSGNSNQGYNSGNSGNSNQGYNSYNNANNNQGYHSGDNQWYNSGNQGYNSYNSGSRGSQGLVTRGEYLQYVGHKSQHRGRDHGYNDHYSWG